MTSVDRTKAFNDQLYARSLEHEHIFFAKHYGFNHEWAKYMDDGVHVADKHLYKFLRSVRSSIIKYAYKTKY